MKIFPKNIKKAKINSNLFIAEKNNYAIEKSYLENILTKIITSKKL